MSPNENRTFIHATTKIGYYLTYIGNKQERLLFLKMILMTKNPFYSIVICPGFKFM